MRLLQLTAAVVAILVLAGCGQERSADDGASPPGSAAVAGEPAKLLSGTQPLLNGEPQPLDEFSGDVVLVVNTASECGFTSQFEQLEALYRERKDEGLVVLGFPADDVAGQEPRDDRAIAEFCEANFGVSFPMFAKSNVVESPVNPLFEKLAAASAPPSWNFNKYLLDRDGRVAGRWEAATAPDDPELTERIDELLAS